MNKLVILSSYAKFKLHLLRNNKIAMKILIIDIFGYRATQ